MLAFKLRFHRCIPLNGNYHLFTSKAWLFLIVLFFSCQAPPVVTKKESSESNATKPLILTVNRKLLKLNTTDGLMYYKETPFMGFSLVKHPDLKKAELIGYKAGQKHGKWQKWWPSGTQSFELEYIEGKIEGSGRSWWPDGTLRSETQYVNDKTHGVQRSWYISGALFKEQNIDKGRELGIQRAWRENGKIYNNYEAKNGRIFGLKRSTMCFGLKNENILVGSNKSTDSSSLN